MQNIILEILKQIWGINSTESRLIWHAILNLVMQRWEALLILLVFSPSPRTIILEFTIVLLFPPFFPSPPQNTSFLQPRHEINLIFLHYVIQYRTTRLTLTQTDASEWNKKESEAKRFLVNTSAIGFIAVEQ